MRNDAATAIRLHPIALRPQGVQFARLVAAHPQAVRSGAEARRVVPVDVQRHNAFHPRRETVSRYVDQLDEHIMFDGRGEAVLSTGIHTWRAATLGAGRRADDGLASRTIDSPRARKRPARGRCIERERERQVPISRRHATGGLCEPLSGTPKPTELSMENDAHPCQRDEAGRESVLQAHSLERGAQVVAVVAATSAGQRHRICNRAGRAGSHAGEYTQRGWGGERGARSLCALLGAGGARYAADCRAGRDAVWALPSLVYRHSVLGAVHRVCGAGAGAVMGWLARRCRSRTAAPLHTAECAVLSAQHAHDAGEHPSRGLLSASQALPGGVQLHRRQQLVAAVVLWLGAGRHSPPTHRGAPAERAVGIPSRGLGRRRYQRHHHDRVRAGGTGGALLAVHHHCHPYGQTDPAVSIKALPCASRPQPSPLMHSPWLWTDSPSISAERTACSPRRPRSGIATRPPPGTPGTAPAGILSKAAAAAPMRPTQTPATPTRPPVAATRRSRPTPRPARAVRSRSIAAGRPAPSATRDAPLS
eukprot:ctg_1028.g426